MKGFNVWYYPDNRWTNGDGQDDKSPRALTYDDAIKLATIAGLFSTPRGKEWDIRVVSDDGITPGVVITSHDFALYYELTEMSKSAAVAVPSAAPINNYVCKACRNEKCSSTEKSCWKCGEPIN